MKKIFLAIAFSFLYTQAFSQTTNGYCIPTYGTVCNSPSTNDLINNFSTTGGITNISNLNSGCNFLPDNYQNVPQFVTTTPGSIINFSVQCGATYQQGFAIWIDWNQDLDFNDPGEKVYESPTAGFQVFTGSFTVPPNTLCGDYRIRVRSSFAVGGANITPCGNQTYGETEDYTLSVINCSSQERTICEGETATIDYSTMLPPTSPITVVVSPMTNVNIAIPNISFNPLDTTIYLVTWTSPDSSWQDTAKIYVNDPLLPTYAGENDTICTGNLVQLQATLGNTNTNYQWFLGYPSTNIGAIYIPNPNVLNPNIISNNPGSVYAIFTETDTLNVCPAVSDTATIIFSSEFHNVVKVDPTCNGYTDGQIIINSTGTLGAVEYSIDNGGTWGTSNTYTGLSAGTYDIISKDVAGCTYASSITLVDPAIVTI
ncbi:MAG: GEVED domain-containing protein, partial [Putridiphycobacter sp.]|nr:GEVED domain-containing protein [Putridiphycobacter sp.]